MKIIFTFIAIFYGANLYALDIYKCKTETGTLSYQDKPCENAKPSMLESKGITDAESYERALKMTTGELGEYQVKMLSFNWWKVFKKEISDEFLHLKFTDDSGDTNISLLIDFMVPPNSESIDQNKLRQMVQDKGKVFEPSSVIKTTDLKPLKLENGYGYYAEYTDASLVGKASYPPGEFLHTTQGLIVKDDLLVNFTLLSDDLDAENHLFALQFLNHGFNVQHNPKEKKEEEDEASLLDRAYTAYYDGDKSKAVWLFEELVVESPYEFKSWIGYCLALRDKNRLQMAMVACDKALSLKPNDPDVLNSILNILIKGRQYAKGLEIANQLIEITVKNQILETITNLGFYAMLDNELVVARKALETVKREGGPQRKVMIDLAVLDYIEGNSEKALDLLRSIKVSSQAETQLIKRYMDTIASGGVVYPPQTNQDSYVNIPSQLLNVGNNQLKLNMVDLWVKRTYSIQGIGKVQIETPENWMEGVQHQKINDTTNRLSLKIGDPLLQKSMITIDVGKVDVSWSLSELSSHMKNGLKLFFNDANIELLPLKEKSKGFLFEGYTNTGGDNAYIIAKNQLFGIIAVDVLSVNNDDSAESKQVIKKIINSIELIESDQTPLSDNSSNAEPNDESVTETKLPYEAVELADSPDGFTWVRMPEAKAAFLKPDGWFETYKGSKDSHSYVISKEQASDQTDFDTGLTLIGIKNLQSKMNMSPLIFSLSMLKEIEGSSENTIIDTMDFTKGALNSFIVRYKNHPENLEPKIIHQILSSNEKTGSLYIIIFEAPKDKWDEAWKLGYTMLKSYLIDDEF